MNVLILTPDAVGSTLLQRMLTIYMQLHEFDLPVINLHELTNGLAKYYSPDFNQELLGKKTVTNWGYYQSLQQVVELLSSVDHYKTSRLAHYHIVRRGDSLQQQIPFYQYLNANFYIIACRRSNVFEHALSMTLNKITKKLNVYTASEKIHSFYDIYKSGVNLDTQVFAEQLRAYKSYIDWSNRYFDIGSYFNYEQDIPRLEQYILDLPVFQNQQHKITWHEKFNISWNDWNRLHYAKSDVNALIAYSESTLEQIFLSSQKSVDFYQKFAPQHWPAVYQPTDIGNLPTDIKQQFADLVMSQQGVIALANKDKQHELSPSLAQYRQAADMINRMIELGIVINGPPIKKQTLAEKKQIIKNFDQLSELYNHWQEKNTEIAGPITADNMTDQTKKENQFWQAQPTLSDMKKPALLN